jgi:hypothetical protein
MRLTLITVFALFAVVAVATSPATSATPRDELITAHAVGGLRVGLTKSAYVQLAGKPVVTKTADGLVRLYFPARMLQVYVNARGRGVGVLVNDSAFRTRSEVGPCSSLKVLRAAFGTRLVAVGRVLPGRAAIYRAGQLVFGITNVRTVGAVLLRAPTLPATVAVGTGQCGLGEGEGGKGEGEGG